MQYIIITYLSDSFPKVMPPLNTRGANGAARGSARPLRCFCRSIMAEVEVLELEVVVGVVAVK